jgi:hypothetical protein
MSTCFPNRNLNLLHSETKAVALCLGKLRKEMFKYGEKGKVAKFIVRLEVNNMNYAYLFVLTDPTRFRGSFCVSQSGDGQN